jgi:hypothetical protein
LPTSPAWCLEAITGRVILQSAISKMFVDFVRPWHCTTSTVTKNREVVAMSEQTAGTLNSDSPKSRLTVRDLLKKYFQPRRRTNDRSDSDNQAPVAPGNTRPDTGVEQQSHPGEVSGKPQRAIPSWCDPIDEKPRSARE